MKAYEPWNVKRHPSLQSWQKLTKHQQQFVERPFYAPSPQAMLITELKKHTMLLYNSFGNRFVQILQCSINIVKGEGGFLTFRVFDQVFH